MYTKEEKRTQRSCLPKHASRESVRQRDFWNETAKYQRFTRADEVEMAVVPPEVPSDLDSSRAAARAAVTRVAATASRALARVEPTISPNSRTSSDSEDCVAVVEDISDKYRINSKNVNINDIVRFSSSRINVYAMVDSIFEKSVHLIILKHKVLNGNNHFYKTDTIIPGLSSGGGKNYANFTRKIIQIGNIRDMTIPKHVVAWECVVPSTIWIN